MLAKKTILIVITIILCTVVLVFIGNVRFETRANEFENSLNLERNAAMVELAKQTTLPSSESSSSQFSIIIDSSIFPNFAQKSLIHNGDYMLTFPKSNKIYIYRPTTKKLITILTLQ